MTNDDKLRFCCDPNEDVLVQITGDAKLIRRVYNLICSDMIVIGGRIKKLPDSSQYRLTIAVGTSVSAIEYEADEVDDMEWVKAIRQEFKD